MKLLPLVLKHLRRNWIRTGSTVVAMALCVLLFCTLQSALGRLDRIVETRSPKRLVTRNGVNPFVVIPVAYAEQIVESAFLALAGGGLGCLLAFTVHGYSTGTANLQSFSEVAYAFRITPRIVASGLLFALALGVAGGLLPALRVARLSIAGAVREA